MAHESQMEEHWRLNGVAMEADQRGVLGSRSDGRADNCLYPHHRNPASATVYRYECNLSNTTSYA
uniref:Uncharacterized protein n=1 Tax=Oryza rufipogon TaxID=4529 RepID=A0A0E0Q6U8_ORYRU